jgi:transcriptional regulator with XRE-family HTH domain
LIKARSDSDLTQEQAAAAMGTTQAYARLESGRGLPPTRTLAQFAKATHQAAHQLRAGEAGAGYAAIIRMIAFATRMDEIKKEYEGLASLPADSDAAAKRRRGFAFERLLNNLFSVDGLEPRAGYRPDGEQVDGSLYLDGRVYLNRAGFAGGSEP